MNAEAGLRRLARVLRWIGVALLILFVVIGLGASATLLGEGWGRALTATAIMAGIGVLALVGCNILAWIIEGFAEPK